MFRVGETVVYGNNGICNIKDISTLDMEGIPKNRLYYILCPASDASGTVYVPVDNPKVVLRAVMSKDDAMALIKAAPQLEPITVSNDKLREETYRSCIRSCEGREWMRLIKTIYERKQMRLRQGKKITATDERYMKLAEEHLYAEFSAVFEIPRNQVSEMIREQIESSEGID